MATESSSSVLLANVLAIYGGISTLTGTITITVSGVLSLADIVNISWPTPITTQLAEYSTLAITTGSVSKYSTNQFPIFTATCVTVVFMNPSGQISTTLIGVQAQAAYLYDAPAGILDGASCIGNSYICWSASKRAGIIVAIIIGGLLVLAFLVWFCCFIQIARSRSLDDEEELVLLTRDGKKGLGRVSNGRSEQAGGSNLHDAGSRGQKFANRRDSLLSGYSIEPPKPLPRVVTTEDYRMVYRVSGAQQHSYDSLASSGLSRRAVVGKGERESRIVGVPLSVTGGPYSPTPMSSARGLRTSSVAKTANRSKAVLEINQRKALRNSRHQGHTDQQERGRNKVRKSSSRGRIPKQQRDSPCRQLYSPPIGSRKTTSYVPVVMTASNDPVQKVDQGVPVIAQRGSSEHSIGPRAGSYRRPRRDDRRSIGHSHDSPQFESQPEKSKKTERKMVRGREEFLEDSPPPIPRKSSRRRLFDQE